MFLRTFFTVFFLCFSFVVQADYFQETVRQIEGDKITAIDVAHHVEVLRANILLRKEEMYLDPQTESEKNKLTNTEYYDEETIVGVFEKFYGEISQSRLH